MDYYEEFGLTAKASQREIRQAYKSLVRLLHPDQHAEEPLARLAELQMKRLNAIYAVLSDPVRRQAYDRSLEPGVKATAAGGAGRWKSGWRRALRLTSSDARFAAWLAGVTLLASGVYWMFTGEAKSRPPDRSQAWKAPASVPPAEVAARSDARRELTKELDYLRRRVHALEVERDAARTQVAEWRAKSYAYVAGSSTAAAPRASGSEAFLPEPPSLGSQTTAGEGAPPRPVPPGTPPALQAAQQRSGASRFAGTWFYTPPRLAASAGTLYPPEYIEVTVVAEGGLLRGRYYGRYRVTDRAISPEVLFHFEGRPQPDLAALAWHGGGGAHGEIRLRLLSENAMEANWSATELGSPPGLAAGTAVLVRRLE